MNNFKFKVSLLIDKLLTGSFVLQLLVLSLLTLTIVLFGTIVLIISGIEISESIWWSFLRMTDFSNLMADDYLLKQILGSIIALLGWVLFGLLISFIAAGIQRRIQIIQKGTGGVHLTDHTIILGWNQNIYSILDEYVIQKNNGDPPLVIMSLNSAENMYNQIKSFCIPSVNNNVICRHGNPDSIEDQKKIRISDAKEVIILNNIFESSENDFLDTDAITLKTVLAYSKNKAENLNRRKDSENETNLIIDILQPVSKKLMEGVLPKFNEESTEIKVSTIPSNQILGRILAQCSFQPGLSQVYQDLFSYKDIEGFEDNQEIYTLALNDVGVKDPIAFEELYLSFPEAIPFGYKERDNDKIIINPPKNSIRSQKKLHPQKHIVFFIAENIDLIYYKSFTYHNIKNKSSIKPSYNYINPQEVLVYGDGFKASEVVIELQDYLPEGSEIVCANNLKNYIPASLKKDNLSFVKMKNINNFISHVNSNNISKFDIIIMAKDAKNPLRHDSVSLMKLSWLLSTCNEKNRPRIVMDLLDTNSAELAKTARADDVIIGTEMISNFLFQISRDYNRYLIFEELLNSKGAEIYFKPLSLYLVGEEEFNFTEIAQIVRERNEILIGYSWMNGEEVKWKLNPSKENKIIQKKITKLIVIAEEND